MTCPFCNVDREIISENDFAFAIFDGFPVSEGHALIVPKRHAADIFDLDNVEYRQCFELVRTVRLELGRRLNTNAFNIGVNCGASAGQTVNHAHIHIIPRYEGDVEYPRGGVRHVVPGKGNY